MTVERAPLAGGARARGLPRLAAYSGMYSHTHVYIVDPSHGCIVPPHVFRQVVDDSFDGIQRILENIANDRQHQAEVDEQAL